MTISSRTPEGWPNPCPMCGQLVVIEPTPEMLDATCPVCGHLLWFVARTSLERQTPQDLPDDIEIPRSVLSILPYSIARENQVLPLAWGDEAILFAAAAPVSSDTVEKLEFILSCRMIIAPTRPEWIDAQIHRRYREGDLE